MNARADIAWSRQLTRLTPGIAAVWAFAALAAAGLHGAGAWWVMRQPPVLPADAAQQAAIMMELAPVAMAPETVETQISTDTVDAVAAEAPPTLDPVEPLEQVTPVDEVAPMEEVVEPVPEETPVEIAEPVEPQEIEPVEETETPVAEPEEIEPVETQELAALDPDELTPVEPDEMQPVEEVVDPVEEAIVEELENIEVPLPMPRPAPPVREARTEPAKAKPVERKAEPKPVRQAKPRPPAPSRDAAKAKVQAERSEKTAARQTSQGAKSSVSPARWQSRLLAHLERRKRYPSSARRARKEGTAYVRFSIDTSGNVGSVSLARSSGIPELDQEVVAMVRRASPVPAPPPGVNRTIMVPVRFSLR